MGLLKYQYLALPLLLALLITMIHQTTSAQNFHLVKDINTSTDASPYNYNISLLNFYKGYHYAVLNGVSYFNAEDGVHGRGLWRSDGTDAGTYQVKDSINPTNIIVSNGRLFFAGAAPLGLWTSDGTEAGTIPVLNVIPPGLGTFVPSGLTDLNGTVFFTLTNPSTQLWRTDGTVNGTVIVKDFNLVQGNNYNRLGDFTATKDKLYFSATSATDYNTTRLCVSDGTANGSFIVSTNIAAPAQMIARSSNNLDPLVYFTASTTQYGYRSLYVTTGQQDEADIAAGFNNGFTFANNYYG